VNSHLRSLLSLVVITSAAVSVVACSKKDADAAPDAGVAMAVVDAAPVATVDPNAMDAAMAAADMGDAAPPTSETYEKQAAATVSNVQSATAELNKLEQEIGN
jgi:hypothetical protein